MSLALLTEPEPPRGIAFVVAPGVRRLVADNPGPMTYYGTNTYLIDGAAGVTVLDPGPDSAAHVAAILASAGGPIVRVLVSHGHADHVGGLPALLAATGAPAFGHACGQHLADGERIGAWTALHTPGHAADHLCFARDDGVVFSGDHVMSFATSVVIPPDGDMAAYFTSLHRMLARDDAVFLPGHGPPIADPRGFVAALLEHRLQREADIVAALAKAAQTPASLVAALYVGLDPRLRRFAEASVLAHLLKLAAEGRAEAGEDVWRARYS
jgi:glyoxylase-like metal-dependent hydrolase (beta-lactamase superfamily II)